MKERQALPLDQWQICDFEPGTESFEARMASSAKASWIACPAPGDTYAALIAAGRLAHPYKGQNEAAAEWVQKREWWWKASFDGTGASGAEHAELVFEGLDTFCDVYVNGELLGSANNMFREWRFDVRPLLRGDGANEILIVFHPTDAMVPAREMPFWGPLSEKMNANRRNLMRKAQFGWGWDWGPNLPTVGIFGKVSLRWWNDARIVDTLAQVMRLSAERCELKVHLEVEQTIAKAGLNARVTLVDPKGAIAASTELPLETSADAMLTVTNPKLWWTNDLGEQPLYRLSVELLRGESAVDRKELKIGLRTIELDQSDDPEEPGAKFFRFVLNGVPIVAKGACWIPASSFVGDLRLAHYRSLLEQATRANMNMMRVWGGGIYEHDAFYDLCDELGMLVWQDFMFACAPYPEDDSALVENIREEVGYQVRRLRHHASLALWCGNNECQVLQIFVNKVLGTSGDLMGKLYYDQVIPEEVARFDAATPYWPGSPFGGANPNSMIAGDVHDWTVWHGVPPVPRDTFVGESDRSPAGVHYQRYAEDMGRFISEFGIHGAPPMSSMARWMNPEDLEMGTAGFLQRIKDEPKDKIYAMLEPVTGLARNLREYIDVTMMVQAEGLKFGVEHFRRRKPHCSGMLIWQFNDCWPCISWSLVDYDGVGKASFYAMTRAYAPVLASFKKLDDGGIELWITNDKLEPLEGRAKIEVVQLDGSSIQSETVAYQVKANASERIWIGTMPAEVNNSVLWVSSPEGLFADNRFLMAPVKELKLDERAAPKISTSRVGDHEAEMRISADAYLLFVGLDAKDPATRFSDNYIDVRPGQDRIIRISNLENPVSVADITVRCWNGRKA